MVWNILSTDIALNKALLQIWRTERYSYTNTVRPDHGFLYLAKGQITYRFAGDEIAAKPGDVIYLPKGSSYTADFAVHRGAVEDILVNFAVQGDAPFIETRSPVCFTQDLSGRLHSCFADVVQAYYETGRSFLTNRCLYECFHCLEEAVGVNADKGNAADLRQAAKMLTDEPGMSIDEICAQLHTSRSSFQKSFKACFGISPAAYRLEKRIENAKLLLETTDIPIKEIAESFGFYDVAYFYKMFERHTARTPGQYRAENRPFF